MKQRLGREVKLEVDESFTMPDPAGLVPGLVPSTPRRRVLDATYFDTEDLRLTRAGLSLLYRSGDGEGWTVKLPDVASGPALLRRELRLPGGPDPMPREVVDLVESWARRKPLKKVLRLRTARVEVDLCDADERTVVTVADDSVSIYRGRAMTGRFREIEVEATALTTAPALDGVIDALRRAGAGVAAPLAKVAVALGDPAVLPADVAPRKLRDDATAGDVVRHALATAVERLLRHDPGVRLGDDAEDVRIVRVSIRRLRSDLRTFRPLLKKGSADAARREISQIADAFGALRDADVLLSRLRSDATRLPNRDAAAVASILRKLALQREDARSEVLASMASTSYIAVLDDLVALADAPPLRARAGGPAADLLPGLVRPTWRSLHRAVRAAGADPTDAQLHDIRLRTKRCRYAVQVAQPVVGDRAKAWAKELRGLQRILGDHQDACVAEHWLRTAAVGAGEAELLVAGELIAIQVEASGRSRALWRPAWRAASARGLRRWI